MGAVMTSAGMSRTKRDADYVFYELTRSICPTCRRPIDAHILLRDGRSICASAAPSTGSSKRCLRRRRRLRRQRPLQQAGRHGQHDPLQRLTIPDVLRGIEEQTEALFRVDDFVPVPCCFPTCNSVTYAYLDGDKLIPPA